VRVTPKDKDWGVCVLGPNGIEDELPVGVLTANRHMTGENTDKCKRKRGRNSQEGRALSDGLLEPRFLNKQRRWLNSDAPYVSDVTTDVLVIDLDWLSAHPPATYNCRVCPEL
jgi:hypothetical protein